MHNESEDVFWKCVRFTLGTGEGTAVIKSQRDCRLSLCRGDAVVDIVAQSPGWGWHAQQSRHVSSPGLGQSGLEQAITAIIIESGLKLEGPGVRGARAALHWLDSLFSKSILLESGQINYVTMLHGLNMDCFIKFIHNMYPASAEFDPETWQSCMECHYTLHTFWPPASQETFFNTQSKLHSPAC